MTTVNKLAKLELSDLTRDALSLPMNKLESLCETTNRLYQLCNNEDFWFKRTQKDYPKYTPASLPSPLTYKEYHRILTKTWNLKDYGDRLVFHKTNSKRSGDRELFLYPVPKFTIEVRPNANDDFLKEDLLIEPVGKLLYLVGMRNRKLITGTLVPALGKNIPHLPFKEAFELASDEVQDAQIHVTELGYNDYFFIESRYRAYVVDEAENAGYVKLNPSGLSSLSVKKNLLANVDLFNQEEKVPTQPVVAKAKAPVQVMTGLQEKKPSRGAMQSASLSAFEAPAYASPKKKKGGLFWPSS